MLDHFGPDLAGAEVGSREASWLGSPEQPPASHCHRCGQAYFRAAACCLVRARRGSLRWPVSPVEQNHAGGRADIESSQARLGLPSPRSRKSPSLRMMRWRLRQQRQAVFSRDRTGFAVAHGQPAAWPETGSRAALATGCKQDLGPARFSRAGSSFAGRIGASAGRKFAFGYKSRRYQSASRCSAPRNWARAGHCGERAGRKNHHGRKASRRRPSSSFNAILCSIYGVLHCSGCRCPPQGIETTSLLAVARPVHRRPTATGSSVGSPLCRKGPGQRAPSIRDRSAVEQVSRTRSGGAAGRAVR